MDERKLWRSTTESGGRATCSDCAWSYPDTTWQATAPPPEDILRYFRAHKCSDNPKSSPRNPALFDRRAGPIGAPINRLKSPDKQPK